jgi:integrase
VATVRQRRPGVWEVRVFTGRDDQGRPTQASTTVYGGKRDAQRVAAQLSARPTARAAGRTVAELLDEWLELNVETWAASTRRDNTSRAELVKTDPIAKRAVARLTVVEVERWHARLRQAGAGEASIRNQHNVLRAALAQAVRWGWISINAAGAARLRHPKRSPRSAMTPDQVRTVLAAAASIEPAAELALRLAAVTGARRSEVAALQWSDIAAGRVTFDSSIEVSYVGSGDQRQRALQDAPTKTANLRTVALDEHTVVMIEHLRAEREAYGPWMFMVGDDPPSPERIRWWWNRSRAIAQLDRRWRLHDLRHWSATTAIGGGADVRMVAGRLGHANPSMTLRVYAHAIDGADGAVAQRLGDSLDLHEAVSAPEDDVSPG